MSGSPEPWFWVGHESRDPNWTLGIWLGTWWGVLFGLALLTHLIYTFVIRYQLSRARKREADRKAAEDAGFGEKSVWQHQPWSPKNDGEHWSLMSVSEPLEKGEGAQIAVRFMPMLRTSAGWVLTSYNVISLDANESSLMRYGFLPEEKEMSSPKKFFVDGAQGRVIAIAEVNGKSKTATWTFSVTNIDEVPTLFIHPEMKSLDEAVSVPEGRISTNSHAPPPSALTPRLPPEDGGF